MNVSELKLKIFRQIDSLEKSKLEDLYGILLNFVNGQRDLNDWLELSEKQRQGILEAMEEINSDKGIPHDEVITKYRQKYSHG